MLKKVRVILIVGVVLQAIRVFFPSLNVPPGLEAEFEILINQLYIIIPIIAGWFTSESPESVAGLKLKKHR